MASIGIKKIQAKPTNPWDEIETVTLVLTKREAQAVLAAAGQALWNSPLADVYEKFGSDLSYRNPTKCHTEGTVIKFKEAV
jgi:hypothetical protein